MLQAGLARRTLLQGSAGAFVALSAAACGGSGRGQAGDLTAIFRGTDLTQGTRVDPTIPPLQSNPLVGQFYGNQGGEAIWLNGRRARVEAQDLLRQVQRADIHGLVPTNYLPLAVLQNVRLEVPKSEDQRTLLDQHLTSAYLNLIADLSAGRANNRRTHNLLTKGQEGLAAPSLEAYFEALAPNGNSYQALRGYLQRQRNAVEHGTWKLIANNMERLRWHPEINTGRWIRVNLANQHLEAYEEQRLVDEMRVVVGRRTRQTPLMQDRIWALKFSPDWTVPPTVIREDMVPRSQGDPGYLSRTGYEVYVGGNHMDSAEVDWSTVDPEALFIRRDSNGGTSPLGGVRFSLTNGQAIYLHDTPAKNLFGATSRLFSSGCVRVERAEDLALWIGESDQATLMDRPAVQRAMRGRTQEKRLASPVETSLLYLSAFIDRDDQLNLVTSDPYGLDTRLFRQLNY